MKHLGKIVLLVFMALILNSCGVNYALVIHDNQNSTQVHLSENNYKVVDNVSGSAYVNYIFAIGGLKKKQLYAEAYSKMLEAAKLEGSSKAIINLVTEEHAGGFPPFFIKRTITVSAHVVEFNK